MNKRQRKKDWKKRDMLRNEYRFISFASLPDDGIKLPLNISVKVFTSPGQVVHLKDNALFIS